MRHVIEFKNPLTIDVNVSVTQKQDDRVTELEKELTALKSEISSTTNTLNTGATELKDTVDKNQ